MLHAGALRKESKDCKVHERIPSHMRQAQCGLWMLECRLHDLAALCLVSWRVRIDDDRHSELSRMTYDLLHPAVATVELLGVWDGA